MNTQINNELPRSKLRGIIISTISFPLTQQAAGNEPQRDSQLGETTVMTRIRMNGLRALLRGGLLVAGMAVLLALPGWP